jgi:hypothetical protein
VIKCKLPRTRLSGRRSTGRWSSSISLDRTRPVSVEALWTLSELKLDPSEVKQPDTMVLRCAWVFRWKDQTLAHSVGFGDSRELSVLWPDSTSRRVRSCTGASGHHLTSARLWDSRWDYADHVELGRHVVAIRRPDAANYVSGQPDWRVQSCLLKSNGSLVLGAPIYFCWLALRDLSWHFDILDIPLSWAYTLPFISLLDCAF